MTAASVMVAACFVGAMAAPASALSDRQFFKPAGALCTAQGGSFQFNRFNAFYACTGDFSEAQLRAARALCEGAYGKFEWAFSSALNVYLCGAGGG